MPSTTDLMQNVYANFLGAYSGGAASKDAVLAFEPLGLMPGLDPGAPGAASTALEYLSSAANVLPDLSGGVFSATERTVSGAYIAILNPAQPIDPSTAGGFNASKAAAMEAYQNGAEGSLLGPYTYYPAFAAPANWYDSTVQDNWTSYAYSAGAPPPPPPIVANPRTPFCLSSGNSGGVDLPATLRDEGEDLSGKIALQGSNGVEFGMPFCDPASNIVLGSLIGS
jgi:hypothetical protein